jgi:hypothetical protein
LVVCRKSNLEQLRKWLNELLILILKFPFLNFVFVFLHSGDSELTVNVWSKSLTGLTDALIGTTKIDLENRFFSEQWKDMAPKPRENRTLIKPGSLIPKVHFQMFSLQS